MPRKLKSPVERKSIHCGPSRTRRCGDGPGRGASGSSRAYIGTENEEERLGEYCATSNQRGTVKSNRLPDVDVARKRSLVRVRRLPQRLTCLSPRTNSYRQLADLPGTTPARTGQLRFRPDAREAQVAPGAHNCVRLNITLVEPPTPGLEGNSPKGLFCVGGTPGADEHPPTRSFG